MLSVCNKTHNTFVTPALIYVLTYDRMPPGCTQNMYNWAKHNV